MVTAMIRKLTQVVQACLLTVVLPSFYGCLGGGGGGGSQFSGFSATDGGTGSFSGGVGSGFGGGAAGGANLVIANGGELFTSLNPRRCCFSVAARSQWPTIRIRLVEKFNLIDCLCGS